MMLSEEKEKKDVNFSMKTKDVIQMSLDEETKEAKRLFKKGLS